MPQDAATLNRLATELNLLFSGAKINKITQPTSDEIILFLYSKYGNARLSICVSAIGARVGITELEQTNPQTPPAFCMLLRKHLIGATIKSISTLKDERIIRIAFDGKNDFLEYAEKELYAEIMGKYSNTIFCENEKILSTVRPIALDFEKDRILLPGAKYALPHSQNKVSVYDEDEFCRLLANRNDGDIAEFLFNNVVGLSSQTAKEICQRYFNDTLLYAPIEKPSDFRNFIISFIEKENNPCVLLRDGKPADYFFCDYSTLSGEKIFFERITDAESYFFDTKKKLRDLTEFKNKLLSIVSAALKKEKKKLSQIADKLLSCKDAETVRRHGELIVSNVYRIKKGDSFVIVDDYYNDNAKLKIALEEQLSPNQNAQKYFKRYTKLKNTVKAVIPQKEQTESEIDYLQSVLSELNTANDIKSLSLIRDELIEGGYIKLPNDKSTSPKKKKNAVNEKYRTFEYSGYRIRAGKNNIQNDKLTATSKPSDCWLHVKDYHSAHVVIESNGGHVPDEIIEIAAQICAYYSEARAGSKVAVDYTLKKYVKKPPKSKFGSVIYTDFKTIIVSPDSHGNLETKDD